MLLSLLSLSQITQRKSAMMSIGKFLYFRASMALKTKMVGILTKTSLTH